MPKPKVRGKAKTKLIPCGACGGRFSMRPCSYCEDSGVERVPFDYVDPRTGQEGDY